jgi:energy-coupling factor transporter ATP-binding protein EcfA2
MQFSSPFSRYIIYGVKKIFCTTSISRSLANSCTILVEILPPMTAQTLDFTAIRQAEHLPPLLTLLKDRLESVLNLPEYSGELQPSSVNTNLVLRLVFAAGLGMDAVRSLETLDSVQLSATTYIHETVFTRNNLTPLWSALVKLRYHHCCGEQDIASKISEIVASEMLRGAEFLAQENSLLDWLTAIPSEASNQAAQQIPVLNLLIGTFTDGDRSQASLNLNGREIPNTQILIAGATGSGKTNLLAVLLKQIRTASVETPYPVNFLLFDYKGEFSDPANSAWLQHFEVQRRAIIDPLHEPLPFNPFKDFSGKTTSRSEINLYATELAEALLALDRATISANMSNRLTEAVIQAYGRTNGAPVSFERIYDEYTALQEPKEQAKSDSVKSMLSQLIRSNLFANADTLDLVRSSNIIKMDTFPKDGILAKALVYFTIAKLNALYEALPVQAVNEKHVELRHFTVIDEAHYMLDFDNKPLRNLIAVGRNKGLSIILATQNMESFRSEYFDFYANAEYPLIMRQQTMNDRVLRDLFGLSGQDFAKLKEAIANLKKGEVILRTGSSNLGSSRKFRKIALTHLV